MGLVHENLLDLKSSSCQHVKQFASVSFPPSLAGGAVGEGDLGPLRSRQSIFATMFTLCLAIDLTSPIKTWLFTRLAMPPNCHSRRFLGAVNNAM